MQTAPQKDFASFFRERLSAELEPLESQRKEIVRRTWLWIALIVPIGIAATFLLILIKSHDFFIELALRIARAVTLSATLFGPTAMVRKLREDYDEEFNACIIRPLIKFFDPNLDYSVDGRVPYEVFTRSRLFSKISSKTYTGKHLISGILGKTRMCFSQVKADTFKINRPQKIDGPKESYTQVFNGIFFTADFNKDFAGLTVILPDRAEKLLGSIGQMLQDGQTEFGELVKLEDPEFEREFVVYSSNQIEARYILSPALMRRILDFKMRSQRTFHMSFAGSSVNIAIDMGTDLFEPRLFRTVLDPKIYESFWNDLSLLAGIVDELNLNARIWTKA